MHHATYTGEYDRYATLLRHHKKYLTEIIGIFEYPKGSGLLDKVIVAVKPLEVLDRERWVGYIEYPDLKSVFKDWDVGFFEEDIEFTWLMDEIRAAKNNPRETL